MSDLVVAFAFTTKLLLILSLLTFYLIISSYLRLFHFPGPRVYSFTKWRLAYDDYTGRRTRKIHALHQQYGQAVRIGPNELSFNSLSALKSIYGAGSGFERTTFYRMFDVYGHQNLFTFASVKEHAARKKLLNHAYSKSSILKYSSDAVEEKVRQFMQLLEREPAVSSEIFSSLHYYSLDNITHFLYGEYGATKSMEGRDEDRTMLNDVLDPKRRKLAWFACHFPKYTKWLMTRTGIVEKVVSNLGLLPQNKPTVYTGIRNHALKSFHSLPATARNKKSTKQQDTIIERLWESHESAKQNGLKDLEIASEAADHLLAGVDTTADTLMFLIWALSLPSNRVFQKKLVAEVLTMPSSSLNVRGIPVAEATGRLPYLDAVIKETLRLYAPLPASEPRLLRQDTIIDGYKVPKRTVVSMSPYTLHRNAEVFQDPLVFNPERWLGNEEQVKEMNRWFWAFSSGGRMCIGLQ
jgi:cytochrome P450